MVVDGCLLIGILPVLVAVFFMARWQAQSLSEMDVAIAAAIAVFERLEEKQDRDAAIQRDVAVLKEAVRRNAAGLEDA